MLGHGRERGARRSLKLSREERHGASRLEGDQRERDVVAREQAMPRLERKKKQSARTGRRWSTLWKKIKGEDVGCRFFSPMLDRRWIGTQRRFFLPPPPGGWR
jgi:hypothetical protein